MRLYWPLQEASFHADKDHRRNTILLKGLTRGEIAPGEEVTWDDEIKHIPPVQPSRLGGGCKNINLKYVLMVGEQLGQIYSPILIGHPSHLSSSDKIETQ